MCKLGTKVASIVTNQIDRHGRNIFILYAVKRRPIIRASPTVEDLLLVPIYRSFATKVSQLKMCDFSGESFKCFEVL